MVSTENGLIIFFAANDGEALYSQQKQRLGADCGSDHKLLTAKFRLKLKKLGKTIRLQQYMNQEVLDGQAPFRRGRGTRDQIANIRWIIKKARGFQKNIYFCFTDYAKTFDCVGHNKLWKALKERGIPDHLTCLLRNL